MLWTARFEKLVVDRQGWTALGVQLACALLVGLIFYVDMRLPLGVAFGFIYVLVVVLALWYPHRKFIFLIAAVSSALVLYAWTQKPAIDEMWKVAYNRGLALLIIWIMAILGSRIKRAEQELQRVASHDFLTGLLNRREMFTRLNSEISRAERLGEPCSVILLDIDHFKAVNDRYGHVAGDKVLKQTAHVLRDRVREYDYVCRYGGEEFLIVAPATSLQIVHELAERLRLEVQRTDFGQVEPRMAAITISAGLAELLPGEHVESLVSRADRALYKAKEGGRNQVALAQC